MESEIFGERLKKLERNSSNFLGQKYFSVQKLMRNSRGGVI